MCAGPVQPLLASAALSVLSFSHSHGGVKDSAEGRDAMKGPQIPESGGEQPGRVIRPETSELEIKLFVCVCVNSLGLWSLNINLQPGLIQKSSVKRLSDLLT